MASRTIRIAGVIESVLPPIDCVMAFGALVSVVVAGFIRSVAIEASRFPRVID